MTSPWNIVKTGVMEHCEEKGWSILMTCVMELCDDKGMEQCDESFHGAL